MNQKANVMMKNNETAVVVAVANDNTNDVSSFEIEYEETMFTSIWIEFCESQRPEAEVLYVS